MSQNAPHLSSKKHPNHHNTTTDCSSSKRSTGSSSTTSKTISSREMRTSRGGSRVSTVTDETRDANTMGSESASTTRSSHEPQEEEEVEQDAVASAASMRDLSFDLEQPWQRSLMRELKNIEKSISASEEKHARGRSHKILLGRGQSGDYLLEYEQHEDDDTTVLTDASSTIPLRPQTVHRGSLKGMQHSSLFVDDEYMGALSTDSSHTDRISILDDYPPSGVHRVSAAAAPTTTTSPHHHVVVHRGDARDTRRDEGPKPPPTTTVTSPASPTSITNPPTPSMSVGLSRANALMEDRSSYLLKSSSGSTRTLRLASMSEETADVPVASACMCIGGYNLLEFLIPPEHNISATESSSTRGGRHKKRRTSRSNSTRSSTGRQFGSLGRVSEEEGPYAALPPPVSPQQSHHQPHHQQQQQATLAL